MKSTGTIVAFAAVSVWGFLASTVMAVPLVPGWVSDTLMGKLFLWFLDG